MLYLVLLPCSKQRHTLQIQNKVDDGSSFCDALSIVMEQGHCDLYTASVTNCFIIAVAIIVINCDNFNGDRHHHILLITNLNLLKYGSLENGGHQSK